MVIKIGNISCWYNLFQVLNQNISKKHSNYSCSHLKAKISNLNSDWLVHFLAETMRVHEKNTISLRRYGYENSLIFITIDHDYLSIMKIGEEGHKTFTYACMSLLLIVKGDCSYIYLAKVKKAHL